MILDEFGRRRYCFTAVLHLIAESLTQPMMSIASACMSASQI